MQLISGNQDNELIANNSNYWSAVVKKTHDELDGINKIIENEKKLGEELTV